LGQPREAVLAAWGITAEGTKALLHLAPGTKEDTPSCRELFQDMRRRGPPDPLLVVSDGAPGVIRAIEEGFPRALRQRCLAHKMRNLQSKLPADVWPEFHARAQACYQAASPALARLLREDIVATYSLFRLGRGVAVGFHIANRTPDMSDDSSTLSPHPVPVPTCHPC
jgi:putative transposase